jgi:hypothetical protein
MDNHVIPDPEFTSLGQRLKKEIETRKASPKGRVYTFHTQPPPVIVRRRLLSDCAASLDAPRSLRSR